MKNVFLVFIIISSCYSSFAQFTKLLDFDGETNGGSPVGSLISDGTFLYGTTCVGGNDNAGTIFKIKPNGTSYLKLHDFDTLTEYRPNGSLCSAGSFLYGTTQYGGVNNKGGIFKIKTDGTEYSEIFHFSGFSNGANPVGTLICDGTYLYGTTFKGGLVDSGTLFKVKLDGTNYVKLLDFIDVYGTYPEKEIIFNGDFLFGMTRSGGIHNMGTLFKIKLDGTEYSKLFDFAGISDGMGPVGLTSIGNTLFGVTMYGGINHNGTIFKIESDGTGYNKLFDFDFPAGFLPVSPLIYTGSSLYGMTYGGGMGPCNEFACGVIYNIKPDGSQYSKVFDFETSENGSNPTGSLLYDGADFYGMTPAGGAHYLGTLFKYSLPLSIDENPETDEIQVFPNPSTGKFKISNENQYDLIITTVLGKVILKCENNNYDKEIDIVDQPQGIYILKVKTESSSFTRKIMITPR